MTTPKRKRTTNKPKVSFDELIRRAKHGNEHEVKLDDQGGER